jgi:hypothetical protein
MTPSWLLTSLAVIMLTVAAVTATRMLAYWLIPGLPWRPRRGATVVDLANVLMGIAMAGMFTPYLRTLPNVAWEAAFGLLTAWFGYRAWADTRSVRGIAADRCTIHVVHSAAMLYAFLALGTAAVGGGMSGMGGTGGSMTMPALTHPTIAGAFALLLVGYSVWDLNQLSGGGGGVVPAMAAGPAGTLASAAGTASHEPLVRVLVLAPQTRIGSDVVLGVGMALMLMIMI